MVTLHLRDELALMLAPRRTYQRLLKGSLRTGARALLTRPALMLLIIATFVTLINAGQLLPTLLLGSLLSFVWVPLLQMAIAALLIALCRPRLRLDSALDLFFAGHGPWSLWLMVIALVLMAKLPGGIDGAGDVRLVALSGLLPITWTAVIMLAFCRAALSLSLARAVVFTVAYEALLWACAYFYLGAVTFRVWPFSLYRTFLP
jgi:hypothetical protein